MGLRLQSTWYTASNLQYDVCIYDKEYSGAVIDFNLAKKQGFIINYQGEEEGMKIPILTSRCDINMWNDSADTQSFVDDLAGAYEGQFRVVIKESGLIEMWQGIVLPDLVRYEDKPQSIRPIFRLTATDGLKRLKKVAYKNTSAPYAGSDSIIGHLTKCISFLDTTDLITFNSWVLVSVTRWVPKNITTGDVMYNTEFDHRALYQVDELGNYKYTSVYDVIKQLCLRFDCQFRMWKGAYYFTQHNYHSETTWTQYRYTSAGVLFNSSSANWENTQDSNFSNKFAGGYFSFFPALNQAQVNYVHFGYTNIAQGYEWDQTTQPTIPESPTQYIVPDGAAFAFDANFFYSLQVTGDRPAFMKFGITLEVDGDYLQRDVNFAGGGAVVQQQQEISSSVVDFEMAIAVNVTTETVPGTFVGSDNVPVPFTQDTAFTSGGAVSFTIAYLGAYDIDGNLISSGITGLNWRFYDVELRPLPSVDMSDYTNTHTVTAQNATSGNSERKVINTVIGQSFGYGRLRINNGASWEDGIDWGLGSTTLGQSIEELLAIETMLTQSVPVLRYNGRIKIDYVDLMDTLVHNSDRWVFYKGKFVSNFEWIEGEWYRLDTTGSTSGNTEIDWVIQDPDAEGNPVLTVVPTNSGGTPPIGNNTTGNQDTTVIISALSTLFPRTTADISEGATVTQIPVEARTVDGEYKVGQTVTLINWETGASQDFTISQESQTSNTVLYVTSDTADFFFPEGSMIGTRLDSILGSGGSGAFYREEFPLHASATITVTVNSGNLPSNAAAIRVYYDNGQLISKNYWSHSGSDITLTYTPNGAQSIWVEFNV